MRERPLRPLRLLLIEDNEDDALLLLRALRREGFAVTHRRVETAAAMTEALDAEVWDAIVSDYALPAFSAPAALELFRSRGLDTPFLVVSGAIGEETAARLMKAGAHDYVSKENLARIGPALVRELAEADGRRRRRAAEAEREHLQAQLAQAQKMEAIGVLTAGIAHDFNNLLGAIQIYTELIQMKVAQGTAIENELGQIMAVTDRAAGLIRQLMLFSRKQTLSLVPFDLNAAAGALMKMIGRFLGERIEVKTDLAPGLPPILGDTGGVEQVIMNLAVNARDAMPEGGTLSIATRLAEVGEEEAQRHAGGHPGRFAVLVVKDTGTGMDEETAGRIFEPFFTTKEIGKGTGLGLSVVYGIVTQHGGWVDLTSAVGAGTQFAIYLPLAGGEPGGGKAGEPAIVKYPGAGERLLIVEDEEGFRGVTAEGLRAAGYVVDEASGAGQARETMARAALPHHLAFIDVVLPDGDGFDLAVELLAQYPRLRVLLTTGYTDEHSRLPAIRERGLPFLAKPFSFSVLLLALRGVLGDTGDAAGV